MNKSLIALAVLESIGHVPDLEDGEPHQVALTDAELPEAAQDLVRELDLIAENARFASDPRQPIASLAAAFAAYFRTPD